MRHRYTHALDVTHEMNSQHQQHMLLHWNRRREWNHNDITIDIRFGMLLGMMILLHCHDVIATITPASFITTSTYHTNHKHTKYTSNRSSPKWLERGIHDLHILPWSQQVPLSHTLLMSLSSSHGDGRTSTSSKTGSRKIESVEEYMSYVINDTTSDRPILTFWTAPWCGPCRLSIPVMKDIMKLYHSTIHVVEINTDDMPDLAVMANVVSIPTIQIYFRGKLLDTLVGCVAKQVLAGSVDKILDDISNMQFRQSYVNNEPVTKTVSSSQYGNGSINFNNMDDTMAP